VLMELLDMQHLQISKLLSDVEQAERKEEELVASLEQVVMDAQVYRQRLAGIKQQYRDRLEQVTSVLSSVRR
jgi:flagellar biosynthesis chaperone FliJ